MAGNTKEGRPFYFLTARHIKESPNCEYIGTNRLGVGKRTIAITLKIFGKM